MSQKISSISICARVTLNMHSLNNEGSEGNQTLTRQVTIFDESVNKRTVNAISGDMLKHIHSEHLYYIAKEKNLPLCKGCEVYNANRITADSEFTESFKVDNKDEESKKSKIVLSDDEILTNALNKCLIDDIHGILITNNKKNIPIKSKVEFGWLVGIPEQNETENYFHVKFSNTKVNKSHKDESNQGQNIFHRPANSGLYALVCNLDIAKIGFNEITKEYAIEDSDREKRFKALLESIIYTFLKPNGAMTSQQFPHILNFEGVVTISNSTIPAPTVSPLKSSYKDEIKKSVENLEFLDKNIESKEFSNIDGFVSIIKELHSKKAKKLFESN